MNCPKLIFSYTSLQKLLWKFYAELSTASNLVILMVIIKISITIGIPDGSTHCKIQLVDHVKVVNNPNTHKLEIAHLKELLQIRNEILSPLLP